MATWVMPRARASARPGWCATCASRVWAATSPPTRRAIRRRARTCATRRASRIARRAISARSKHWWTGRRRREPRSSSARSSRIGPAARPATAHSARKSRRCSRRLRGAKSSVRARRSPKPRPAAVSPPELPARLDISRGGLRTPPPTPRSPRPRRGWSAVPHLDTRAAGASRYPTLRPRVVSPLAGSGWRVTPVWPVFPAGLSPFAQRLEEVQASVAAGAQEIDIVITRAHVLTGDWPGLYAEVRAFRDACGRARMKAILGTGELATLTNVARASMVAMMAGADFIKTSTGKEPINAVLPVGVVMARMIREYETRTGAAVGFKPAGGIRAAKQALDWMILMKEELGDRWLRPTLFRLGASALLTHIERQLEHFVTGRYAAAHRHPMV